MGYLLASQRQLILLIPKNAVVNLLTTLFPKVSGWRLVRMLIPDALLDLINSLQQNMLINAPTTSQTAALKCWDDETIAQLESHVEKCRKSRTFGRTKGDIYSWYRF